MLMCLVAAGILLGRSAAVGGEFSFIADPADSSTADSLIKPAPAAPAPAAASPAACQACQAGSPSCQATGCGECCANRNWIVEVEGVWLSPTQHQNFGSVQLATVDPTTLHEVGTQNDGDFTLSPRITLGVQGECWGLLARYWHIQTGDVGARYDLLEGNGTAQANAFQAQTFDLEATRLLCTCGGTEMRASFGVRYAQLDEANALTFNQLNGEGYYEGQVFTQHCFNGVGPTLGITGIRPSRCCSNFHLFFDGRVSLLFDSDTSDFAATRATWLSGAPALALSYHDALASSCGSLFISEVQVGGQWDLPLKCVPANAFFRLAFEYQYWSSGGDNFASATSSAGPEGGPAITASARSNSDTHVNLVGFNIGTGLTW
jgi:hypothetical protein